MRRLSTSKVANWFCIGGTADIGAKLPMYIAPLDEQHPAQPVHYFETQEFILFYGYLPGYLHVYIYRVCRMLSINILFLVYVLNLVTRQVGRLSRANLGRARYLTLLAGCAPCCSLLEVHQQVPLTKWNALIQQNHST